jgi:putative ABC transport system permease protein
MLLAALGVAGGLAAASWLTRVLASLLFGVQAGDPMTLGAVSLILLASAFPASCLPATRAATVDPMIALRCD